MIPRNCLITCSATQCHMSVFWQCKIIQLTSSQKDIRLTAKKKLGWKILRISVDFSFLQKVLMNHFSKKYIYVNYQNIPIMANISSKGKFVESLFWPQCLFSLFPELDTLHNYMWDYHVSLWRPLSFKPDSKRIAMAST